MKKIQKKSLNKSGLHQSPSHYQHKLAKYSDKMEGILLYQRKKKVLFIQTTDCVRKHATLLQDCDTDAPQIKHAQQQNPRKTRTELYKQEKSNYFSSAAESSEVASLAS